MRHRKGSEELISDPAEQPGSVLESAEDQCERASSEASKDPNILHGIKTSVQNRSLKSSV